MPTTELYTTEPPPIPAGVDLRVYSNPICPFAQRAELVLAVKKIPHDLVHVHLKRKPVWYLGVNPRGQVPFIEHKGQRLPESFLIFEYLDDVYDGIKLFSIDPMKKAMQKLLVQDFEKKFIGSYYAVVRGNNVEENIALIITIINKLEELLKENNFLFGDKPSAADYLVWPYIERLPGAQILSDKLREAITSEKFPVFFAWRDRMLADEAVKATGRTPQQHADFMKLYSSGEHAYDLDGKDYTIHARKEL